MQGDGDSPSNYLFRLNSLDLVNFINKMFIPTHILKGIFNPSLVKSED